MQMAIEAAELTKAWFKRARESMRIGTRMMTDNHAFHVPYFFVHLLLSLYYCCKFGILFRFIIWQSLQFSQESFARKKLNALCFSGRRSRQLELFEAEGVPKLDDPERFSFWVCHSLAVGSHGQNTVLACYTVHFWQLINLLNIRPSERLELLRLQDTSKVLTSENFNPHLHLQFLRALVFVYQRISRGLISLQAEEQGCRIQQIDQILCSSAFLYINALTSAVISTEKAGRVPRGA